MLEEFCATAPLGEPARVTQVNSVWFSLSQNRDSQWEKLLSQSVSFPSKKCFKIEDTFQYFLKSFLQDPYKNLFLSETALKSGVGMQLGCLGTLGN